MGREPRPIVPGGIFHVTSRGNDGQPIYLDDHDRAAKLAILDRVVRRFGLVVLTYCEMTNHDHWIFQDVFGRLSDAMQALNTAYSRRTNRRYGRTGHLIRNRFDARLIETEAHLLQACRYVVLNPVRAGMRATPQGWPWSSYRALAGLEHPPAFLTGSELLRLFSPRPEVARREFRRYVRQGLVPVSDTEPADP
jgi:REP element-mobilizing transposase RayT